MESSDYRLIFESLPGLYLILLPNLHIAAASEAYLNTTKTKREEIMGRGVFEVFPDNPSDPDATGVSNLRDSLELVLKDRAPNTMAVQKYDVQLPESQGGGFEVRYWSVVNIPVLDKKGEVCYIINRVEEVTEFMRLKNMGNEQDKLTNDLRNLTASMETEIYQRAQEIQTSNKKLIRLNDELTQREEEIRQVYKRLFDMDQLKSQFFANVSHELRTPLTLIIGPTRTLLKQNSMDVSQRYLLETIERNSYTLLKHVNDLLDVSKLEAGKMTLNYSSVNLSRLVQNIAAHFDSVAKERNIEFELNMPESCPAQVDAPKIERVVLNLISNAFKFTPDSGKIQCSLNLSGTSVWISIGDSGSGVPVSQRELIFEKFRQGEEGDSRSFGGTGLGLSIAKDFVTLHLGSIQVYDSPLGGALFKVQLPLGAPEQVAESNWASNEENQFALVSTINEFKEIELKDPGKSNSFSGKPKILIVEDNPEMRRYIFDTLSSEFHLIIANDGKQGLEKTIREKPNLIITDVMMPNMSGDQMVREIRQLPEFANTSIIFLSAKSDQNFRIKLLQEGAQDYLIKPFTPEELIVRVNNLITLQKTIERLESTNKDMESFSYSVSHDLRAPIRWIQGFVNILMEDFGPALDPEAFRLLQTIDKNTTLMSNLIQDLLSFHRVTKFEMKARTVDMENMVKEVVDAVLINYPKISYSIEIGKLPNTICDRAAIKQVWVNLISNAIKYSSTRDQPCVKITSKDEGEFYTYTVKDNGVGFDKKYANKLFKVFQRLHLQEEFEGTGVGLAIVDRIVQRHGGQVFAEGEVNLGSTFSFTLPKFVNNEAS